MQIFFSFGVSLPTITELSLGWGIEELGWVFLGADYSCSHVQIITLA